MIKRDIEVNYNCAACGGDAFTVSKMISNPNRWLLFCVECQSAWAIEVKPAGKNR
jgi:transcription elongation factor Elf1